MLDRENRVDAIAMCYGALEDGGMPIAQDVCEGYAEWMEDGVLSVQDH